MFVAGKGHLKVKAACWDLVNEERHLYVAYISNVVCYLQGMFTIGSIFKGGRGEGL